MVTQATFFGLMIKTFTKTKVIKTKLVSAMLNFHAKKTEDFGLTHVVSKASFSTSTWANHKCLSGFEVNLNPERRTKKETQARFQASSMQQEKLKSHLTKQL